MPVRPGERIELLASAQEGYGLRLLEGGGAEQDPRVVAGHGRTTASSSHARPITPEQVAVFSFCSPDAGAGPGGPEGGACAGHELHGQRRGRS